MSTSATVSTRGAVVAQLDFPHFDFITSQAVATERVRCAKVARDEKIKLGPESSTSDMARISAYNLACEQIALAIERGEGYNGRVWL